MAWPEVRRFPWWRSTSAASRAPRAGRDSSAHWGLFCFAVPHICSQFTLNLKPLRFGLLWVLRFWHIIYQCFGLLVQLRIWMSLSMLDDATWKYVCIRPGWRVWGIWYNMIWDWLNSYRICNPFCCFVHTVIQYTTFYHHRVQISDVIFIIECDIWSYVI